MFDAQHRVESWCVALAGGISAVGGTGSVYTFYGPKAGALSACLSDSLSLSLSISIGSSNPQSREEKKFAGLTKSFLTDDLCPGKGPDLGCLGSPSEL